MSGFAIGIDVGGTFTDIVVAAPDRRIITAKAPSTPADQTEGVLAGLALASLQLGLPLRTVLGRTGRILHGTTVATNALIEGKTARVGMLTTAGHRDVIEMREGLKPERYNLRMPPPEPLVPRDRRLPVRERLRADGSVATPLDRESLADAIERLAEENIESVAICFLHSWRNPQHEEEAAASVHRRLPNAYVTCSAAVLPEIEEFERFCTSIANAAVGPIVQTYLARLARSLEREGFSGSLLIMLSHGGLASATEAARLAAGTVLSGPAGGVAAGVALARRGLAPSLITFDMGGTSTDIALIQSGRPMLAAPRGLGEARIALPALDIVTLGAGGGSIARVDASGLLQVGPESAGADPGPACYGRGGNRATVTDANLVLGLLDPEKFLGGRRRLDRAAAEHAIAAVARLLELSIAEAAAGIHRVVNARMADGLRLATVRRGVDPRGFMLLAFGGAAGLHAGSVAAAIGITTVAMPLDAAVLSAWGMLNTDLRLELSRTRLDAAGIDAEKLQGDFAVMEREGRERLGWFKGPLAFHHSADMRYGEQVFEINVPLDGLDWHATGLEAVIAERFHARHETLFTYDLRDEPVVLVNARLSVIGALPPPTEESPGARADGEPVGERRILFSTPMTVPCYDLANLRQGQSIAGPALIDTPHTTILVHPEEQVLRDARGWLVLCTIARPALSH